MKKVFGRLALVSFLFLIGCGSADEKKNVPADSASSTYKKAGTFQVMDPKMLELVDTTSGIEILAEGFEWSEGPLWIANGNYLLFSDIPPNKVMKWSEEKGLEEYLHPSGASLGAPVGGEPGSNGLILDKDGRLVLCQHGDRRMARMDAPLDQPQPKFITLADKFEGKRLNSPNDAVYHKNGDLFFTDPPYGLPKNVDDSSKEIPFQGVYRLKTDGKIELVTKNMSRPNGIAFSPDYSKLYVANSDGEKKIWNIYDVAADGTTGNERLFVDANSDSEPGGPDGMKVDKAGNIYATGPGGVWVMNSDGKLLGKIKPGQLCSNVALNADGTALYITADPWLVRVKLKKQ